MYPSPLQHKISAGFTIIEMMVSLALFTIVITIATGAFLSLIGGNSQLQGEQKVMTSLAFAMDSMTREIRTGTRYYCNDSAASQSLTATNNCATVQNSMSFVESGASLSGGTSGGRIAYLYNATNQTIDRRVGGGATAQAITSSDVVIKQIKFLVSGANPMSAAGDIVQPSVTIVIQAEDPEDTSKTYTLETTVTQRELDI